MRRRSRKRRSRSFTTNGRTSSRDKTTTATGFQNGEGCGAVNIINDDATAVLLAMQAGVHRQMMEAAGRTPGRDKFITAQPASPRGGVYTLWVFYYGFEAAADNGWICVQASRPELLVRVANSLPVKRVEMTEPLKGGESWN